MRLGTISLIGEDSIVIFDSRFVRRLLDNEIIAGLRFFICAQHQKSQIKTHQSKIQCCF